MPVCLAFGAAVHILGFLGFHWEEPPIPLESTPAALSLIGWLVAASYLLSLGLVRTLSVGIWVGLVAALLTLGAPLGLRFPELSPTTGSGGAWPHVHVLLSAAGFALLALSGTAGIAYLLKEHALKHKRPSPIELPSLESLDRLEHVALAVGFPLLTLGVVSGYVWALEQGGNPWSPHALLLLAAWLVFLLPVTSRLLRGEKGPRPSRGIVLGFVILLVSYLGVSFFRGGA
jgi:ABC-type uncharacterized transport system permease subunit